MRTVQAQIEQYVANGAPVPPEAAVAARNISEPGLLADMVAYSPDMSTEQRQEMLETIDVTERLKLVSNFLANQIEILELKGRIQSEVKSEMDKTQREYILREQLKAIQRELGEDDPQQAEINELRDKVEAAGMPDEIKTRAIKEVDRMSRIPSASPEVGVIRTYVDWLIGLPWNVATDDHLDIKEAARILDEDHYGLEKIKERILEYLAVRTLADEIRSPILAFVGPPGVGKTSLGKSIARAMDRKFVRMSLGGIHDEAEIRGHRRTYIGALPGRIIQSIKTAGSNNPVFMLDEVDKIGMDFRGDPSSALLEVLDPEQNNTFQDNYLEVPFDLSKVLFVATANLLDPIPPALRDRMEIVHLPGYTEQEKIEIGKRFLVPKQMENHGLKAKHIEITDEAMTELVRSYTHEAGVRNLERELANVMRKVARQVAEGRKRKTVIDPKKLADLLGPQRFEYGELEAEDQTGSATGLVVTEVGGDVVAIEVTRMEGREDFILTGQLGEVMRESARAGLSWTRAHAAELGIHARDLREEHPPHPRAGRRHPQGRPVGRDHDGHRHRQRPDRHPRPQGRGDDRRDHPPRSGPPDRRAQEQDPGRAPRRAPRSSSCRARTRRTCATSRRRSASRSSSSWSTTWTRSSRRPFGASRRRSSPSRRRSSRATTRSIPSRTSSRPSAARNFPPTDQPPVVVRQAVAEARGRAPQWRAADRHARRRRVCDIKDYYAVLGVPRTASQAEIKKAFRKLARQHHPDAKPGDTAAERRFKEINEANEVLSDPAKRKQYDQLGANWEAISRAREAGAAGGRAPVRRLRRLRRRQRPLRVPDQRRRRRVLRLLPDVLRRGGDGAPAGGSTAAGRSRASRADRRRSASRTSWAGWASTAATGRPAGARRPRPVAASRRHEATAEITLDEAYHGTTRLVEVDGKRLEVTIPPGADTGTRIKLTGADPAAATSSSSSRSCPTRRSPAAAPTSSASCR